MMLPTGELPRACRNCFRTLGDPGSVTYTETATRTFTKTYVAHIEGGTLVADKLATDEEVGPGAVASQVRPRFVCTGCGADIDPKPTAVEYGEE